MPLKDHPSRTLFCFRLSSAAPSFGSASFVSCSSRVTELAHGSKVRLLDPFEYRILRINPTSQNVTLPKINAPQNHPFVRPATQIWVPPPTSVSVSVDVKEPLEACRFPSPLPPPVLPDISDAAFGVSMETEEAMELLVTEFDSVQRPQQGFEETLLPIAPPRCWARHWRSSAQRKQK